MDLQLLFWKRYCMRESRGYRLFFFDTHPELNDTEIFVCNANADMWNAIELETKRKGTTAFYYDGTEIRDTRWFPVFAQASELAFLGIYTFDPRC